MKKVRLILLSALALTAMFLCSCADETPQMIESILGADTTAVTAEESGYGELFSSFKKREKEYFRDTYNAANTLIGQKYVYVVTAYNHSDELSEIAEMFFSADSEKNLNIYFALRGFENKEYKEEENRATYSCTKKDEKYVYSVSYDTEKQSFEITLSVDENVKDVLKCRLDEKSLFKLCYSGYLNRTFISRVYEDGKSKVSWYDELITDEADIPAEGEHGYVDFDGATLSGEIK